jgi:2-dehydro-3-deoxyphosphogluconate aldolase/(4S)-4-hydroxy-2-oxoglutarate aldolase
MKKIQLIQQIVHHGVVAVLRGETAEQVVEMAEHVIAGGIKIIEVAMTVPFALKTIEKLAVKYSRNTDDPSRFAIIGAGTVLDAETARLVILHGAEFVVGPSLNPATIALCNRYRIPVMPGVMTVNEIQAALDLGVDIVKLFPGNLFSPSIIKAIKGPLPQVNIMPTGNVSLDNVGEWVKAGAVAVGVGSDLTAEAIKSGDYSLAAKRAAQYIKAYQHAKL